MAKSIFITGSSGFIGSTFMKSFDFSEYDRVYCLTRDSKKIELDKKSQEKIQPIFADINDARKYESSLQECETIIHLAAATGKAISRDEYFNVNSRGTQTLVGVGRRAGVVNILHISTVAVKYPDISKYYYAQSKQQAEKFIHDSGLKYSIVRPTIVVGKDGSVWNNLARLAKMPLTPIFGDGKNRIQPIHIDDLVECIAQIIRTGYYQNDIIEIGGPEIVTFESFLAEIHRAQAQKPARFIRFPYKPVKIILSGLERPFHRILPVTAGQLSAFGNDGTIDENPVFTACKSSMRNIREMVTTVVQKEKAEWIEKNLWHEGKVYTQFLIHQEPTPYVLEKYRQAHYKAATLKPGNQTELDKFVLNFSRKNPLATRLADAYTVFFMKGSTLRKKLVLLMAILESSNPSAQAFEQPDSSNVIKIFFNLGFQGMSFALAFFAALLIFMPARLWFVVRKNPGRKEISYG